MLIEDGILVGYMQDRQNARLMSMKPTGNGRRQDYAHVPMPRMTNTYMLAGSRDPAEILASVKNGIYAANFGGGQVDITSGKYVFQCTEAYKIENGKIGAPLKGAMLIGNGPTDLHRITMIGNDLALDDRHRHLRQERPGRAGRRRPADAADGTHYGRRNGRANAETSISPPKPAGWRGQVVQLAAIVLVVFVAKGALAEPFYVPSGSMEPTLLIGDALLASKYPLRLRHRVAADPYHLAARPAAFSATCRSAATSWCSAGPATARRSGSSASSACPATVSRCGAASSGSTARRQR